MSARKHALIKLGEIPLHSLKEGEAEHEANHLLVCEGELDAISKKVVGDTTV